MIDLQTEERDILAYDSALWARVRDLDLLSRYGLLSFLWGKHSQTSDQYRFFLKGVREYLKRFHNLYECQVCFHKFHETDMNRVQQEEQICPNCGHEDLEAVK